jgi:hypothetical protein
MALQCLAKVPAADIVWCTSRAWSRLGDPSNEIARAGEIATAGRS